MAHEMDMIPGEYRKQHGRRRLLRQCIVVSAVLMVSMGLLRGALTYLVARENGRVQVLEQQQQRLQNNETRMQALRQQKQLTEQQLAELDKLRGRDRVAVFLHAMDKAHSEGVWFDTVRFMRRSAPATPQTPPALAGSGITVLPQPTAGNPAPDSSQGAVVIGHALNHSRLAELMRQLGAQGSVADLRLIDTGTRNYTSIQVVDFNLALQINETAQVQP